MALNRLFYGDNLDVLRQSIPANSIDLVYLDPPFNSNRSYNVIFNRHDITSDADSAQIQAFDDTWKWTPITDQQYQGYITGELPNAVADALTAFHTLLGRNDALAYLVNMAPRLVELHRVLRSSGSLYLHCDPTMSHYLKVLLDAIFGPNRFKSEIIWKRTTAHNSAKRYGPVHDVIFYYVRSDKAFTWNPQHQDYSEAYVESKYRFTDETTGQMYRLSDMTGPGVRQGDSGLPWKNYNPTSIGRHWQPPSYCYWKYEQMTGTDLAQFPLIERLEELNRIGLVKWPDKANGKPEHKRYLEDMPGVALQDVWTDIDPINARAAERLGYPTQKPLKLLDRIISASTNEGDTVLDPFAGCGTAIDSAQQLKRNWLGIDVTYIAVDLIEKRLKHTFGSGITSTYEVLGIPRDRAAALALFSRSPFDFERWAVSLVNGQPNQKQVGDKGVDGVARFALDGRGSVGRVLVSVKGGKQLNPSMVRDLGGTVTTQKAEMGILVTNGPPTRGMVDEANHAGTYQHPHYAETFPRIQMVTVDELLSGKRPKMPPTMLPYIQALRAKTPVDQGSLFDPN